MAARYKGTLVPLRDNKHVKVYASPRVADALAEVLSDMTQYKGVRLAQVLEAVYVQGKNDGSRQAIEELDRHVTQIKRTIPHRKPGRPRKRRG
jgi:hypothetical protein